MAFGGAGYGYWLVGLASYAALSFTQFAMIVSLLGFTVLEAKPAFKRL